MFKISQNKICLLVMLTLLIIISADPAYAYFDSLKETGKTIFNGLRSIIFPASAVGIIAVCMGGFFGNVNWKWLTAIIVGLIVISLCGAFLAYFLGENGGIEDVQASIKIGS